MQTRHCARCNAQLGRHNADRICLPCQRLGQRAPSLPAGQWHTESLSAALRSEDMGVVIAAYRHHPIHGHRPLPQGVVAGWLGITQGQLSRIENGRSRVRNIDTLVHYAQVLQIPAGLLWFSVPDLSEDEPGQGLVEDPVRLPGRDALAMVTAQPTSTLAEHLLSMLGDYAITDMLTGPRSLIPVIEQQTRFIEHLEAGCRGRTQERLLYVRARYAEFLGWLHQDSGDPTCAMHWSNTAHNLAQEIGAAQLESYIQMRKSNIATDAGHHRLALALSADSLRAPGTLTPQQRAVALRQKAHCHASAEQVDDCRRALDEAREYSARNDSDDTRLASYCTTGYVEMEAAACWVQLRQPDRALATLTDALAGWEPRNRRDLGLGLARLATAYAETAQPDEAFSAGSLALGILETTHSHRIAGQLIRASEALTVTGAREAGLRIRHRTRAALR